MRFLFLLSILLLSTESLRAAPVGHPASSQLLQEGAWISGYNLIIARVGYQGDWTADRLMKQVVESSGRVDRYEQSSHAASVLLSFVDRFDLYGVLGAARIAIDWRSSSLNGSIKQVQVESKESALWRVGARGILYEWGRSVLGLGGSYTETRPPLARATLDGAAMPTLEAAIKYQEWQVDLNLTHRMDPLVPYIGVKYSQSLARVGLGSLPLANGRSALLHMEGRNAVGLVVGCGLTTGKSFLLNFEGRMVDEEALTVSGEIRF